MLLYNTHIARQLLQATLLIVISLTSIVWLMQALRYVDFIVHQGISILLFLKLTLLLVPWLFLMILPPAFFCAVIFTYSKLQHDNELMVMQSMGLDTWQLTKPALRVGLFVMLTGYAIAFYLQPLSYHNFRNTQIFLRNNYVSILLQEGVFSNPVNGLTVFIRERHDDGTLRGILVHDNRKAGNAVTMMADQGMLVQTPSGPRFLLQHGNRQEMRHGKLSLLNYDSYSLDISLYTNSARTSPLDVQELFLKDLWRHDDQVSTEEHLKRRSEFHHRLLWPAYSITLPLIALSVLLSGEFNRRRGWKKLTAMIVGGMVLLFGSTSLRGALIQMPSFSFVLYLVWLLPTAIALWILCRKPSTSEGSSA